MTNPYTKADVIITAVVFFLCGLIAGVSAGVTLALHYSV